MDLQIDVASGAIDSHVSVAFAPLQRGQMLQVHVDESDGGPLEGAYCRLLRLRSLAQAMALEAAMDGAAGQLAIDASPHDFDDVIERQLQLCSQFTDQALFH